MGKILPPKKDEKMCTLSEKHVLSAAKKTSLQTLSRDFKKCMLSGTLAVNYSQCSQSYFDGSGDRLGGRCAWRRLAAQFCKLKSK